MPDSFRNASALPRIFDQPLLLRRRLRALRSNPETFLLRRVAEDVADRLKTVLRRFDVAVDLGTPTSAVRDALLAGGAIGTMVAVDPLFAMSRSACAGCSGPGHVEIGNRGGEYDARVLRVAADDETLPFADASLDLVVSGLILQAVNDLPGVLKQVRRALKPDGLLLAALLGNGTLAELRHCFASAESEVEGGVSPRVAPFPDLRDMGALLQRAGFALPVVDVESITVRYNSPLALLHDLRRMGATNPLLERRRVPLRRETLMRAIARYATGFADSDGKVRASFEILWLSGWSPHESQQRPLRPGSAKARLADALGTVEFSTGDKPGA